MNAEVPSPFEGILREILVEEGATVPNNAEIAVIETADDGAGASASTVRRPRPSRLRRPDRRAGCSRVAADRPRHRSDPRGRHRAGRQRRTGPAEMAAAASTAPVATAVRICRADPRRPTPTPA